MTLYLGKDVEYLSRAIRLMEHLEGTKTLERVILEAEREKLLKLIPKKQDRLLRVECELRGLK